MRTLEYRNRIRDAVHGFIHLNDVELSIVDTPPFRRLRNVKQLSFTYYVYPGAMHSRHEHSLGVMELASSAFDFLASRFEDELEASFKKIHLDLKKAKSVLRLAALLHDVGHLPFSHGGESILPKGMKHEDVSVFLIENYYKDILEKKCFKGITPFVSSLIKKGEVLPELQILRQLLSGQLDADRMDYLIRDSLHCGVRYGSFDYRRLLESLRVKEGKRGGFELAIERGGVHSLEALLLARYFMFTPVYLHRTRRIYDIYLGKYLTLWNEGQYKDPMNVVNFDDITLFSDLRKDSENSDKTDKNELARKIVNRKHHSMIFETNDHADGADIKKTTEIFESLKKKWKKIDFLMDTDGTGTTHKFHIEGDEKLGEQFFVLDKFGKFKEITQESKIIQKIPKNLRVVRIYGLGKQEELAKARTFANQQ